MNNKDDEYLICGEASNINLVMNLWTIGNIWVSKGSPGPVLSTRMGTGAVGCG